MSSHDYLPSASPLTVQALPTCVSKSSSGKLVRTIEVETTTETETTWREEHNHGDGDQGERSDVWQHDVVAIKARSIDNPSCWKVFR
ncbi:hypothetical protein PR003_g19498 [Phytophthora rubi]|uniref:Uncharacterized protein n=1 Tax=Phytophthora rubi TaxID=129364 RepID=A0A6A3JXH8_9STRA|nr:hypothetical protein PR002_g18405 [Phytophthora rubi]KAE9004114.1 hypothetical protein PR001_g17801 [Phytophthora rubi]KAE9313450.1 hypothetical protein PR003_g19498 [Phytophthora rubi]